MGNAPCRNCPDKYPGCHDHCKKEDYLAFRAEMKKIRENEKNYTCPIWKHGYRDSRRK